MRIRNRQNDAGLGKDPQCRITVPDVPVVKDRKDTTMTHLNAHNADTGHVGDDVVLLHCVKIRLLTKTDLGDRERERKEDRKEKINAKMHR